MRAITFIVASLAFAAHAQEQAVDTQQQQQQQPALRGPNNDKPKEPNHPKQDQPEGIIGENFLHGIQAIIGADPNVPADQVKYKPFMGSFANVKSEDDPALASTSYCLTDNACGHFEAYSQTGVSLSDLGCNKFCFIDKNSKRYVPSAKYTIQNPPKNYLCCGWETC